MTSLEGNDYDPNELNLKPFDDIFSFFLVELEANTLQAHSSDNESGGEDEERAQVESSTLWEGIARKASHMQDDHAYKDAPPGA